LRPGSEGSQTILSAYAPGSPRTLRLRQSHADLVLGVAGAERSEFYIGDVFSRGELLQLTSTVGAQGTAVYVNGKLAKRFREALYSFADLAGTLILSGLPTRHDAWPGEILGIAIYNQELAPAQVLRHFENWTARGRPEAPAEERAVAVFLFDEHAGRVVRNQVSGGTSLYIPERYQVLEQVLFESAFKEFKLEWAYWQDVIINIGGFMPFGFFFCAYLSWPGDRRWAYQATILLGAATSLIIEALQSHLPTRDSSTTDVIMNTAGTCIGVWLFARTRPFLMQIGKRAEFR
jgi:hypothetical protein